MFLQCIYVQIINIFEMYLRTNIVNIFAMYLLVNTAYFCRINKKTENGSKLFITMKNDFLNIFQNEKLFFVYICYKIFFSTKSPNIFCWENKLQTLCDSLQCYFFKI